ncbi:MAG: sugar ABC transporter permease [Clostridia bacterium]|nr:sugar ABC transporter permease [Clostridia bacterium]
MSQKAIKVKRNPIQQKNWVKLNLWCWAFVSLTLIFYVLFQGYPILCSVYYSLFNWSGMTSSMTYVGLDNYKNLLNDSLFWGAFKNSFRYMIMVVPLEVIISLFFAYLLNDEKLKCRTAYRVSLFVPVVVTASIVGIVMVFIWSSNGIINNILTKLHFIDKNINWLGNATYAMKTVVIVSVWKDMGTYMIYWLAALQGVPNDVMEAASVDGATRTRTFFSVVVPIIAPTAGIILILCTINSLKAFDLIQTLTGGGPFYATDVIATFVYRTAFTSDMGLPRFGYASAAATMFGVVVIIIGAVLNALKGRLQKMQ